MIVKVSEVDPNPADAGLHGRLFELVLPFNDGINDGTAECITPRMLSRIDCWYTHYR